MFTSINILMTASGLKTIKGQAYIDLQQYVDLEAFDKLQPNIYRGFALAKHLSDEGALDVPPGITNLLAHNRVFKPLYQAYRELMSLPDDDPVKMIGIDLENNYGNKEFVAYLKHAMGAYDLYTYHVLCDFSEGWREDPAPRIREDIISYFPGLKEWILNLQTSGIFSNIGRITFMILEASGISFEHYDPALDPEHPDVCSEFIHIRPNLNRPFYVRNDITKEKIYVNTRVGYWNDQDWHGGESIMAPSYSLRIDGVFTPELKRKLKI